MRSFLLLATILISGMSARAQAEVAGQPAPVPATAPVQASQPPSATNPEAQPVLQPSAAPAAHDPWTGAPTPYSPPNGYPPAYPMPYPYPPPVPGQPPPGFHTHDGFFMRLLMGVGFLRVASASGGYDLQASGATFGDMVSFGWSLRENLALSLDTSVFMGSPSVRGKSRNLDATDAFFALIQIGPGLTYYFMPQNIFAQVGFGLGSLLLSERRERQEDLDHSTNMGWGATLSGGKEWWTSDNWGLGVAGRFVYVQAREGTTDSLFRGYSLSVAFSATYN